jgi:hypothetical protein
MKVYLWDAVKLTLIREIEREGKVLNLATHFEFLWQDLHDEGILSAASESYFFVGDGAGFTDTRVVYVWLKSQELFEADKPFFLTRTHKIVNEENIARYMEAARENTNKSLQYSKEPRIGIER